jgi:sphingomyelin phosphodiesterase acid-like 3
MVRLRLLLFPVALLGAVAAAGMRAQTPATVPVLMISDVHVEVFHDPAKLPQLLATPAAGWQHILAQPDSATQAEAFAALRQTCPSRGPDTTPALLTAALAAAHAQSPHALFVTLSGDLLAHQFDCSYRTLRPHDSAAAYSAFAAKTVEYIAIELRRSFPRTPVYVTLGNNDSGCGDYDESEHSSFLAEVAKTFRIDVLTSSDRAALAETFSDQGDWSVALPAPLQRARLIMLQDIFEAHSYKPCAGTTSAGNDDAVTAQIAWLRTQLQQARARHEQVWVMGHIPPQVDLYNTYRKSPMYCAERSKTSMFLSSDALFDTLTEFADVIRLALFAHTHNDEIHLLHATPLTSSDDHAGQVAMKLVPSISPINGNTPAFTLAQVNPRTASGEDYEVYTAGAYPPDSMHAVWPRRWTQEYRFSTTYGVHGYTPQTLAPMMLAMTADHDLSTAVTLNAEKFYVPGITLPLVRLTGLGFACAMSEHAAAAFRACTCGSAGASARP